MAFRLLNRSVDELSRMVLRGGVTGIGAAIWLGMVKVMCCCDGGQYDRCAGECWSDTHRLALGIE